MNTDARQAENTGGCGEAGEARQSQCAAAGVARDLPALLRRLGPVGPLALIAASLPAIGGFVLLGSAPWSAGYLQSQGGLGIAVYVAAFAVLSGLALLPTYAQAVVGGFAFGVVVGTSAALGGIVGGAAIGYLIARHASGDRVVRLIAERPRWKAVYDALIGSGSVRALLIVTLLRVPPNSPFAITNLVMAACQVRPVTYLVGTGLGIAPRTAAAAFIGAGLSELDLSKPRKAWMIIATIAATVIVVLIIGAVANRAIVKVTTADGSKEPGGGE